MKNLDEILILRTNKIKSIFIYRRHWNFADAMIISFFQLLRGNPGDPRYLISCNFLF